MSVANQISPILPHDLMVALEKVCPGVAADIRACWGAPVTDYARRLLRLVAPPRADIAVRARAILRRTLAQRLAASLPSSAIEGALTAFDDHAVVQAGVHSQLLLDPISFNAFLLGWLGAVGNQLPAFFVFAGSTVTMETVGKEGPGWLDLGDSQLNLFGMGRHKLCRQSVCGAGPVALNGKGLQQLGAGRGSIDILRGAAEHHWGNAADAFADLNASLVAGWDDATRTRPVFFDDRHAALVMADHLADANGLVTRLLTETGRRGRLEETLLAATGGPLGRFLPTATDHFWGVRDKRVRKLVARDGRLSEVDRPQGVSVPLERAALHEALLNGVLIPNLFWLFVVMSILPCVRVLGGFRQIGYVPVFQQVLTDSLDPQDGAEGALRSTLGATENAWGMRVIEPSASVFEQERDFASGGLLQGLRRRYETIPLAAMTDGLKLLSESSRWRRLMRAYANDSAS